MIYLMFFKNNWKIMVIIIFLASFYYGGWHNRGISDTEKTEKAIQLAELNAQQQADIYESKLITLNDQTDMLNQQLKDIYASDAYKCVIPANGLRIIKAASH